MFILMFNEILALIRKKNKKEEEEKKEQWIIWMELWAYEEWDLIVLSWDFELGAMRVKLYNEIWFDFILFKGL